MKKLKLNANAQGSALNRNELKKVLGGVAGSEDFSPCSDIKEACSVDTPNSCGSGWYCKNITCIDGTVRGHCIESVS